ncbi:MAG: hypothetical protein ACOX8S_11315 [Christensenellales bacterium]|jgi:hypothetical protein
MDKSTVKSRFLRVLLAPYEALSFFPFYLLISRLMGTNLALDCTYALLLAVSAYFAGLFSSLPKLILGIPAYLAVTAGFFIVAGANLGSTLTAAAGLVMFLYCLLICTRPADQVYRGGHLALPAASYLLIYMLMFTSEMSGHHLLGYGGMVFICISLPLYNYYATASNVSVRKGASRRMRALNAGYTLVVVALTVVLANIAALRSAFVRLFQNIVFFILWLFEKFAGGEADSSSGGGGGGTGIPPELMEDATSSRFWDILGIIVQWLVVIALIVGAILGLYFGGRWLYRFIKKKLSVFIEAYNDGYADETQTLKTIKEAGDEFMNTFKDRVKKLLIRPKNWEKLSVKERIRYVYQVLLQRAAAIGVDASCMTPGELMNNPRLQISGDKDLFRQSYDEARYSTHEISPGQVDNAKTILHSKK